MNTQGQQSLPYPHHSYGETPLPTDALAPSVVVVNQPYIQGQNFFMKQPYLQRGAQFDNGCHCLGSYIIALLTVGGFFAVIGLMALFIGVINVIAFAFLAIGGTMVAIGVYCIRVAKAQFDSLPPDHPDRIRYNSPDAVVAPIVRHGGQQPTYVYSMPPMQHQVMNYSAPPGGHAMYNSTQPAGESQMWVPSLPTATNAHLAPNIGGASLAPNTGAPVGFSPQLQGPYSPENDLPPAYSDVVKGS